MSPDSSWSAAVVSDPFLRPPSDDDRAVVEATGGVVDETIAGAA